MTGPVSAAVGAVTDTAAGLAAQLPGPVGTTASQTIKTVGTTVQKAIPPGPGSGASRSSGSRAGSSSSSSGSPLSGATGILNALAP